MRRWWLSVFLFVSAVPAFSQSTTAMLVGRVTSESVALPGVIVTITSPALQGARSVETSVNGTYSFPAVPPGRYRVTFAMSGLQTVVRSAELQLAETTRVDADLRAMLSEQIEVTPAPPAGLETQQVTANFAQEFVNILPIGRAILDITKLAPGVQDNGPRRQLTINGAHSFENLYLVNGAVITEARRGQPQNLFIEDAIQETTVLTAGISAEYGRFTGGVISVITKQGGNDLGGSLRDTVTSDSWTARTPNQPAGLDKINHDFEGTLGGRILRDRLWFFGAGRYAERRDQRETVGTEIPYVHGSDERRWEMKLTALFGASQTLVGSYLDVDAIELNTHAGTPGDLRVLYDVDQPHSLLTGHYSAILSSAAVVEGQYTQKEYGLTGGGPRTDAIRGTQIQDFVNHVVSWAPTFCSDCGESYRDNREVLLKSTMFFSSPRWGTHSIVAGVNDFHELAADAAHLSPSDFSISTAQRLEDGQFWVTMVPGESSIEWNPVLIPSRGDDFGTRSAYVNDRIDIGSHWTFNAGIRYDRTVGHDQGGEVQARDSRWSPRLAAIWDIGGDRRDRVSVSFGRYAAKIHQFVAKLATAAGEPSLYSWTYDGPELNTGDGPLLSTDEVLRQVFAWFDEIGGIANTDYLAGYIPAAPYEVAGELKTPVMDEIVLGYGRQFGTEAYLRADAIRRRWHDFYTFRATSDLGRIDDPLGSLYDRIIIENSDEGLRREYDGISLQGTWRRGGFTTGGNYTLSRLRGNVEQEAVAGGTSPIPSPVAYYPEYTGFANYAPMGYLSGDERHRGNLWVAYQWPMPFGRFSASMLQTYHSGRRYHARAFIDPRPFVQNPGYAFAHFPQYFFSPRGSFQLDDISATNLALNFSRVVGVVEAFVETDIINVFNRQGVEGPVNQTVRTSRNDRNLAPFDPFTATPIECPQGTATSNAACRGIANYSLAPTFGQPTSNDSYQAPRTYRISVGVRF